MSDDKVVRPSQERIEVMNRIGVMFIDACQELKPSEVILLLKGLTDSYTSALTNKLRKLRKEA